MKKYLTVLFIGLSAISGSSQTKENKSEEKAVETKTTAKTEKLLMDLANATLKAHGGDKLKNMKTLTIIGSVDITPSNFSQVIPATFITIFAGDKYRFELNNPFQPFKQIYDGNQTFSNIQNGFFLPPVNRMGFPLIPKIGDKDFVLAALPDDNDVKKGFRITLPEGDYTDFYVDKKTGQIKKYESSYTFNGNTATTSAEIDSLREVDGIFIPEKYAQRFDMGQLTIYAEFKAKEIIVNRELADDVFVLK